MSNSRRVVFILLLFVSPRSFCQTPLDSISKQYVEKTVRFLASDKLKGRVNYSKEQLEAAAFLSKEYENFGLHPLAGFPDFYAPFHILAGEASGTAILSVNGKPVKDSMFFFIGRNNKEKSKQLSDFIVIRVDLPLADSILFTTWNSKEDILFWVSLPSGMAFSNAVKDIELPTGEPGADILILGSADEPRELSFTGTGMSLDPALYNIVGMLPGKSLPGESIIFSAHYDHVDNDLMGRKGDIFNGANDDASGVAAVLALAKYYAMRNDNERTLVFCLFAGEELGLLGSQAFAATVEKEKVKAVINIEMIGKTNVTGKKAFFVTGPESSNLTKILSKNLKKEKFRLIELFRDPGLLFQRSDNYSFFQKGIPAHSIMCSDDNEPCYHKPCDDAEKLDYDNMILVIKAIAKGVSTLVSGVDTPVLKK